jgi:hypothetical protein
VQVRVLVAATNGPEAATQLFRQGGPMPNLQTIRQMYPGLDAYLGTG